MKTPCVYGREDSVVKKAMLPKAVYRFTAIPSKPQTFLLNVKEYLNAKFVFTCYLFSHFGLMIKVQMPSGPEPGRLKL